MASGCDIAFGTAQERATEDTDSVVARANIAFAISRSMSDDDRVVLNVASAIS